MTFPRIGGLAAIGFATVILLGNVFLIPLGLPLSGADIGEVIEFFGTAGTAVGISSALTPAAWTLSTVFAAGAIAALRRSEHRRGEAWSLIGFAGVILQNGAVAAVIAVRLGLASMNELDRATTTGLWVFHDALLTLNGTFLALALFGLSIAGLRAGLTARWHTALGLLSGALMFSSATLTPLIIDHAGPLGLIGLIGWLLWVVWLFGYGVILYRAPSPQTA